MRHTVVVLSSNFVSALAVVGVSAVEPGRVEAASTVKSCTGGDVRLSAAENISRDDGRPSRDHLQGLDAKLLLTEPVAD